VNRGGQLCFRRARAAQRKTSRLSTRARAQPASRGRRGRARSKSSDRGRIHPSGKFWVLGSGFWVVGWFGAWGFGVGVLGFGGVGQSREKRVLPLGVRLPASQGCSRSWAGRAAMLGRARRPPASRLRRCRWPRRGERRCPPGHENLSTMRDEPFVLQVIMRVVERKVLGHGLPRALEPQRNLWILRR